MSLLAALLLVPLVVAIRFGLPRRGDGLTGGRVVALVALLPLFVAGFLSPQALELPRVLVHGGGVLELDAVGRGSLLLFGGAWFVVGLLMTQAGERGPRVMALLLAFVGVMAFALARGGSFLYAGMLVAGYGLYAIVASDRGAAERRTHGGLIVLLVISDLLIFEFLLGDARRSGATSSGNLALLVGVALWLRSGAAPAHGWLPPAMRSASRSAAVLLAVVPAGMAWYGGIKLWPADANDLTSISLFVGLIAAAWAMIGGICQRQARATLGYAVAASSALVLMALPVGAGQPAQLSWLVLALLASGGAAPILASAAGTRWGDAAILSLLLGHGLAAGHMAAVVGNTLPVSVDFLPSLGAVMATLVMTLAVHRFMADEAATAPGSSWPAFFLLTLAAIGLWLAWRIELPGLAALWTTPAGITLGLLWNRCLPSWSGHIAPGDFHLTLERAVIVFARRGKSFGLERIAPLRDASQAWLLNLWNGAAWSRFADELDKGLRSWHTTGLMALVIALVAVYLLVR